MSITKLNLLKSHFFFDLMTRFVVTFNIFHTIDFQSRTAFILQQFILVHVVYSALLKSLLFILVELIVYFVNKFLLFFILRNH